MSFAFSLV